jgi:hypothetical protein
MGFITSSVRRALLGGSSRGASGQMRVWRGLRERDRTELMIGLALTGLSWLRRTRPEKELLYRKKVPVGSAIVIYHKRVGAPRIEVVKPKQG